MILAEAEDDAELFGIDAHGEAEKADQRDEHHGDQDRERAAHAAARHGLAQRSWLRRRISSKVRLLAGPPGRGPQGPPPPPFQPPPPL